MAVHSLTTPIPEEAVRRLRVGDTIFISGVIYTARDAAHKRIAEHLERGLQLPFNLRNGVVYHCGPIAVKRNSEWVVVSAGPTTSMRMEPYEHIVIERLGARVVVGKGGMSVSTAEACKRFGAVYAIFTGGAGVLAAQAVKRVVDVHWLDLGTPEAVWVLEVENFGPLTIAIDTTGKNLIEEVLSSAAKRKWELLSKK
jgi:fumarate hydratase subunit beta